MDRTREVVPGFVCAGMEVAEIDGAPRWAAPPGLSALSSLATAPPATPAVGHPFRWHTSCCLCPPLLQDGSHLRCHVHVRPEGSARGAERAAQVRGTIPQHVQGSLPPCAVAGAERCWHELKGCLLFGKSSAAAHNPLETSAACAGSRRRRPRPPAAPPLPPRASSSPPHEEPALLLRG